VNDNDDGNGADGRHQEHNVEPTMVKIKLKFTQNFSYNCPRIKSYNNVIPVEEMKANLNQDSIDTENLKQLIGPS